MRSVLSIFILFITSVAWAGHAIVEDPTVSSPHSVVNTDGDEKKECEGQLLSDDQIKAILKKAYQPFIRTLDRPVDFFHYGYRTPPLSQRLSRRSLR